MEKISYDSSITVLDLKVRAINSLNNARIFTIGELVCRDKNELLNIKNLGLTTLKEIVSKTHALGFVFRGEKGYNDQLRNHLITKLSITDLSIHHLDDKIRSQMLDLKIYELCAFIPKYYKDTFLEYRYPEKTLQDILKARLNDTSNASLNISSLNAVDYIFAIGENRNPWTIKEKCEDYKIWIKAIHELGFYFSDELGYQYQMDIFSAYREENNLKESSILDTKIEELNLSNRVFHRLKTYRIFTLRDVISHDLDFYLKIHSLGSVSLEELKNVIHSYGLLFKNEVGYEELMATLNNPKTKEELCVQYEKLSMRLKELLITKKDLEIDNMKLQIINQRLEELITSITENKENTQTLEISPKN